MLTGAWIDVSKETIKSCFRKGSLIVVEEEVPAEPMEDHDGENCDSGIHPVWAKSSRFLGIVPDHHDIVTDIKCTFVQNDSDSEVEDVPIPSAREALAALDVLRHFCGDTESSGLGALKYADKVG